MSKSRSGAKVVLYVMDTLGLSGRTKAIIDLALHLDPARYRPFFCSLGEESSPLAERLREREVPVEVLPVRPGLRAAGAWALGALIRRTGTSVIHPVNLRPMLYAGLAARALRIRASVASLSAFACQVPDREYRFLPQDLVNKGRRSALRNQMACALMARFVVVSQALGERFCRFTADEAVPFRILSDGALRRRMRAISYGIDLEPYESVRPDAVAALRERIGCGTETVLVGSVGRLVEQKDYSTQLRAFALASRIEPRLRMVLAGDGPLRETIERDAAELRIADRLVMLGHWERVPELLRALDVYVLASKFEPYGVALLEAKCAGGAIVATRVNEVPTIVGDGVSGLIVSPEAPEEMAAAFVRLARDPGLRRALSGNALEDARMKHSIHAVVGSYQSIYDEVSI